MVELNWFPAIFRYRMYVMPRDLLRHTVATLAYRAGRALRGAPPDFASFKASSATRTPAGILALGDRLAAGHDLIHPAEKILQGPIADAVTQTGQIAMLRRIAGAPVRGEDYFMADIVCGRVGAEQIAPKREFE